MDIQISRCQSFSQWPGSARTVGMEDSIELKCCQCDSACSKVVVNQLVGQFVLGCMCIQCSPCLSFFSSPLFPLRISLFLCIPYSMIFCNFQLNKKQLSRGGEQNWQKCQYCLYSTRSRSTCQYLRQGLSSLDTYTQCSEQCIDCKIEIDHECPYPPKIEAKGQDRNIPASNPRILNPDRKRSQVG